MNSQKEITLLPQRWEVTDMTVHFTDFSQLKNENLIQVFADVISSIKGEDVNLSYSGKSIAWEGGAEYMTAPRLSLSLDVIGKESKNFWASSDASIINFECVPSSSNGYLGKVAYVFEEWPSKFNFDPCLDSQIFVVASEQRLENQNTVIYLSEQMDFNFLAAFGEVHVSPNFLENENYLKQLLMLKFCYSPVIKFHRHILS